MFEVRRNLEPKLDFRGYLGSSQDQDHIKTLSWVLFDPCTMIRWRALLLRTCCSHLLRSSIWTKSLENKIGYALLPEHGFHHEFREVCGIFDEPFERVEAEAENRSAASEGSNTWFLDRPEIVDV